MDGQEPTVSIAMDAQKYINACLAVVDWRRMEMCVQAICYTIIHWALSSRGGVLLYSDKTSLNP